MRVVPMFTADRGVLYLSHRVGPIGESAMYGGCRFCTALPAVGVTGLSL